MWDVRDVGYSGCGMWDVGCGMFAGMWDVDLQDAHTDHNSRCKKWGVCHLKAISTFMKIKFLKSKGMHQFCFIANKSCRFC